VHDEGFAGFFDLLKFPTLDDLGVSPQFSDPRATLSAHRDRDHSLVQFLLSPTLVGERKIVSLLPYQHLKIPSLQCSDLYQWELPYTSQPGYRHPRLTTLVIPLDPANVATERLSTARSIDRQLANPLIEAVVVVLHSSACGRIETP